MHRHAPHRVGTLLVVTSLAATTTGCSTMFGDGDRLAVVGAATGTDWDAVRSDFTDATGIRVTAETGTVPSADADAAYLDLLPAFRAHEDDLLAPFTGDGVADVPRELRSDDDTWFTVHTAAVAIIVNTDALGDTEPPAGWEDLTKKRYDDMIAFPDPVTDSVGYTMIHAVERALGDGSDGWDGATDWAADLVDGGATMTAGDPTAGLVSGETPIVVGSDAEGRRLAASNEDIVVVLPEEGTLAVPYVMAKLAVAPNPGNADAFLSYALTPAAQSALARSFLRPVTDAPIPVEAGDVMDGADRVAIPDVTELEISYGDVVAAWNIDVFG